MNTYKNHNVKCAELKIVYTHKPTAHFPKLL